MSPCCGEGYENTAQRGLPCRRGIPAAFLASTMGVLYLLTLAAAASWGMARGKALPIDLYLVLLGIAFLIYGLIVLTLVRGSLGRRTLQWLMVVAILARVVTLLGPQRPNSDNWRYLWDGHLLASGHNPYAYAPDDPALDPIRDTFIYEHMNPDYNHIRTVYGPVAVGCFAVVTRLPGDPIANLRLLMTLGDVATILLIAALLRRLHLPEGLALIYALNPLTIDSFAQRAQMDALMLPFVVAALLLLAKRRGFLAGAALGGAALVKFIPVLYLPLFARAAWNAAARDAGGGAHDDSSQKRADTLTLLAGFGAVVFMGGLPVVLAGSEAFQGLVMYSAEWRTNSSVFAAIEALGGAQLASLVAFLVLGAVCLLCLRPTRDIPALARRMSLVTVALLLMAPAVFPWYVAWVLPFTPFLFRSKSARLVRLGVLIWSGTVLLWYLRFLAYPPMGERLWPSLAAWLQDACTYMAEPWRVVEYAPVLCVLAAAVWRELVARRKRQPEHPPGASAVLVSERLP